MTDTYRTDSPASGDAQAGTADAVKDEAANLKSGIVDAGKDVAGTAQDEASGVLAEAKSQASDLLGQVRSELREQAATQQTRAAAGLKSVGDDLDQMSQASSGGLAAELVSQASTRAGSISSWLDSHDPESLVDEVKNFARRRPGTFIAVAAVVGLLAGRLTRSVAGNTADDSSTPSAPARKQAPAPAVHAETWAEPTAPVATVVGTDADFHTGATVESDTDTYADTDVVPTPGGPAVGAPTATPVYSALTGDGTRTGPDADTAPAFGDDEAAKRDDSTNEFGAGNAQRSWGDDN